MVKEKYFYMGKEITEGCFMPVGRESNPFGPKYTEVRANISGPVADVKVIQKFHNEFSETIEAVYVFPLPTDSAVAELEIKIEERIIKSEVKERTEARRIYEEARDDGRHGALLEQERPNIFTMSVANIKPSQEMLVTLRYYETVKYEDGEYEFVFPTTITPRYSPDGKEEIITPRIAGKEINIFVNLDTGFETGDVTSQSHRLFIQEKGTSKREIQLAKEGEVPNKDFVLKYSSMGEKLESHILFYRKEFKPGTFLLHMTPKVDYGPEEMIKREMVFVLDRSGSMDWDNVGNGSAMDQAKKAVKSCLRTLRSGDCFSIVPFDDQIEYLCEESLEFNEENLKKADDYLDTISARGGTEILPAMKYALKLKGRKNSIRQIIFLTDGSVSNEDEILREVKKVLGKSRIYTFGIGDAVNRYLLDKMAESGRGAVQYLLSNKDIEESIQKFSNQTAFPILCDISLDWQDVSVADVYPCLIKDLFFGEVLQITGRFHSDGKGKAIVKFRTGEGEVKQEIEIELPEKDETYPALETLWARKRIDILLDRERDNPKEKHSIREEIISIAMKYHLMSPYTSLVAVEKEKDGEKEEIRSMDIPVEKPEMQEMEKCIAPPPCPAPAIRGGAGYGASMATMSRMMSPVQAQFGAVPSAPPPGGPAKRRMAPAKPAFMAPPPEPADKECEADNFALPEPLADFCFDADDALCEEEPDLALCCMEVCDEADVYVEEEECRCREYEKAEDMEPPEPMAKDMAVSEKKVSAKCDKGQPDIKFQMETSLKWLIRNQKADGSWSNESDIDKKIMSTAFGILAFIGQGHTNKTGNYKPQIGKAIAFIESNMEKSSPLSKALSSWIFFELYNITGKKKEKTDGEKMLGELKETWKSYITPMDCMFAGLSAKSAVKSGLAVKEDFSEAEQWISNISAEDNHNETINLFIKVLRGNKDPLHILSDNYNNSGNDAGTINIGGINILDGTAVGLFIMSWESSGLIARQEG